METLLQDLRYAMRMLRKNPGFTATAVITLALGIGANTAIFSMVNAVLLRPLPFRDPGRLVLVFATDTLRGHRYDVTSYPAFADWREQNRSFVSMAAFTSRPLTIGLAGQSVVVATKRVSPSLFDVLDVQPALGRRFRDDE